MGETSFKFRCVKSYENSTKPKRKKIRIARAWRKIFSSPPAQRTPFFTNSLLYERSQFQKEGDGGGAGWALDRASLHLTSEKKRNGTKGGGAVGRGSTEKLARLRYIFIEGAARTGGGGEREREGGRTQFKCKHGRHVKVGPPLG